MFQWCNPVMYVLQGTSCGWETTEERQKKNKTSYIFRCTNKWQWWKLHVWLLKFSLFCQYGNFEGLDQELLSLFFFCSGFFHKTCLCVGLYKQHSWKLASVCSGYDDFLSFTIHKLSLKKNSHSENIHTIGFNCVKMWINFQVRARTNFNQSYVICSEEIIMSIKAMKLGYPWWLTFTEHWLIKQSLYISRFSVCWCTQVVYAMKYVMSTLYTHI